MGDAGVVDEDVQAAVDRPTIHGQPLGLSRSGQVGGHHLDGHRVLVGQDARQPAQRRSVPATEDQGGTRFGEGAAEVGTDASGSTGDQGAFARQQVAGPFGLGRGRHGR